jgi:hypothetical protein
MPQWPDRGSGHSCFYGYVFARSPFCGHRIDSENTIRRSFRDPLVHHLRATGTAMQPKNIVAQMRSATPVQARVPAVAPTIATQCSPAKVPPSAR